MFMLMRILKCRSTWVLNKDHPGTLQTYKAYIRNSLVLNLLGGSPGQVSFPSLHLDKYALCVTWHASSLANARFGTKLILKSAIGFMWVGLLA